ncbi:iron ABC transporter permease [Pseudogemmatithrix spongiicola]|uniref:Iron ABC transporter permease n=1 Tax=Pseudogemmatithrix spongiicola TaxID=3062599 RepID=A0AA49JU53_9BACT|nr:iron ABC transporter permease [Gemmatimonadaceae bacterium 'strain 138']WKW14970.1 iron ABC transporter permease [Gemmatimonadaceae bacterium 'strain 318']
MSLRLWLLLVGIVIVAAVVAVAGGAVPIAALDVLRALVGQGDATQVAIVQDLRLPRIALGITVGAGLAVSGAALQTTLRNPLAEPYLLGVSGGAAAGAVTAVTLGIASAAVLPLAAFAGAVAAVVVVLLVARAVAGHADPRVLLMAGVVVGAFCTALIMVALATAPENTVRGALWWMMGSLGDAQWRGVRWVALYVAVGIGLLVLWARDIDVLALGEDAAASLGLPVERVTRRVYFAASLLAAATVAGAGLIGFVGLIVPAIGRALGARNTRESLLAAALVGAALVVLADLAARTLLRPAELPLGAVTALIGVPFFLWRLRRMR